MSFIEVLLSVFSFRFMLTPFSVQRTVFRVVGGTIGYSNYRIFGILVARIQETKPWE